jgi:hypothetical protein
MQFHFRLSETASNANERSSVATSLTCYDFESAAQISMEHRLRRIRPTSKAPAPFYSVSKHIPHVTRVLTENLQFTDIKNFISLPCALKSFISTDYSTH